MKKTQNAKDNMYKKLLAFFAVTTNASIWAAFARLVSEIGNFKTLNQQLDKYIQAQQNDISGVTQAKNTAFDNLVAATISAAHKAYVWAVDANNSTLQAQFDVQKTDFYAFSQDKGFARCKSIIGDITTNIGSMASVNLLPADTNHLAALVTAYAGLEGTPKVAQGVKTDATDGIDNMMVPIDKSLDLIEKMIVSQYSSTNADMVAQFQIAKAIDNLPTHHNGLHVHVSDSSTDADLEGATVEILTTGKTATTDINGVAEIIKVKHNTYNVQISMTGYTTQTIKTQINVGKVSSLEVKLVKV